MFWTHLKRRTLFSTRRMPSPLTPPLPSGSPDEVGNVGSRCPAEAMAKASWFLGNCGLLPFVSTANYLEVPDDKIFIERYSWRSKSNK